MQFSLCTGGLHYQHIHTIVVSGLLHSSPYLLELDRVEDGQCNQLTRLAEMKVIREAESKEVPNTQVLQSLGMEEG